jgi:hypothetical protein
VGCRIDAARQARDDDVAGFAEVEASMRVIFWPAAEALRAPTMATVRVQSRLRLRR